MEPDALVDTGPGDIDIYGPPEYDWEWFHIEDDPDWYWD